MTIGEFLRSKRVEKQLSLEDIAKGTNIRVKYLQAIENSQMETIPSQAQARGFIRLYSTFLGLNPLTLIDDVEKTNISEEIQETNLDLEIFPDARESKSDKPKKIESVNVNPTVKKRKPAVKRSEPDGITSPIPQQTSNSDQVFLEIGKELKRKRESLDLSLADVERQIKVREFYIYALEHGEMDDLPSTVQGRGMLNNYAAFLDIDPTSLQLRYAEGLQLRRKEQNADLEASRKGGIQVMGREPLTGWRRFLTPDLLIGGSVFIVLFGLIVWGAVQVIRTSIPAAPVPTLSSISDVLVSTGTIELASPEGTEIQATPSLAGSPEIQNTPLVDVQATLTAVGSSPIQVVVIAFQRAFMKVGVDGKEVFNGRVIPGNVYSYAGSIKITLTTGNAAAIQVYYNQEDLGILGLLGQVVSLEFTARAVVTPTPQFPPTPTITQQPTLTPRPTITPLPTPTAPTPTLTPFGSGL